MQIHELTRKKNTQVDEAISDLGTGAAKVVNKVRDIGGAIASPFKDIAQGYKSTRQDQKVGAMADRAFRIWQNYVAQLEQSVAKGPAPATPATTSSTGGQTQKTDTGTTHTANANNPNKTTTAPDGATATTSAPATPQSADATARGEQNKGFGFNRNTGVAFNSQAEKDAFKAQAGSAPVATTPPGVTPPAKPNYGAQTGAGAKVTYNQPTSAAAPTAPPVTRNYGTQTGAGAKVTAPIPGKETEVDTLKELQAPVSPALAAFRARTDGKYESYLRAFVQKNLLAGMGSRELVNSAEIDQSIKEISKPENADPAKQRPLWNDLVRAAALAAPAARSLTDRTGKGTASGDQKPGTGAAADDQKPGTETPGTETPGATKPTMTKGQISQWISRNSEDQAALSALLAAINSAGKA